MHPLANGINARNCPSNGFFRHTLAHLLDCTLGSQHPKQLATLLTRSRKELMTRSSFSPLAPGHLHSDEDAFALSQIDRVVAQCAEAEAPAY